MAKQKQKQQQQTTQPPQQAVTRGILAEAVAASEYLDFCKAPATTDQGTAMTLAQRIAALRTTAEAAAETENEQAPAAWLDMDETIRDALVAQLRANLDAAKHEISVVKPRMATAREALEIEEDRLQNATEIVLSVETFFQQIGEEY